MEHEVFFHAAWPFSHSFPESWEQEGQVCREHVQDRMVHVMSKKCAHGGGAKRSLRGKAGC